MLRNCVTSSFVFLRCRFCQVREQKFAAPSNPASIRMTFTGIARSMASNGAFARNASMNAPDVSAGRSFGAMPPPTKMPPVATVRSARFATPPETVKQAAQAVK